ncbi:hypothetical protein J2T17_006343 [Paenibacillus mucilaginosus]|uniref:hypothetical protein n=1 Tax=Paenibacillus mucilaginosus TaxID=61624 RepID=UPI003D239124
MFFTIVIVAFIVFPPKMASLMDERRLPKDARGNRMTIWSFSLRWAAGILAFLWLPTMAFIYGSDLILSHLAATLANRGFPGEGGSSPVDMFMTEQMDSFDAINEKEEQLLNAWFQAIFPPLLWGVFFIFILNQPSSLRVGCSVKRAAGT